MPQDTPPAPPRLNGERGSACVSETSTAAAAALASTSASGDMTLGAGAPGLARPMRKRRVVARLLLTDGRGGGAHRPLPAQRVCNLLRELVERLELARHHTHTSLGGIRRQDIGCALIEHAIGSGG